MQKYNLTIKNYPTTMKLVIDLLMLPIVIVCLLLVGLRELFWPSYSKNIPKFIEKLALENNPLGVVTEKLTFDQVFIYANKHGLMKSKSENSFEFELKINTINYNVSILRAHDGSDCAIFQCRPISNNSIQSLLKVDKSTANLSLCLGQQLSKAEIKLRSSTEIVEIESIVTGLNSIFDKHTEKQKW